MKQIELIGHFILLDIGHEGERRKASFHLG